MNLTNLLTRLFNKMKLPTGVESSSEKPVELVLDPHPPGPAVENKKEIEKEIIFPLGFSKGDVMLDVLKLNVRHEVSIIKKIDASQFFPFLASCICGSQGRSKSEQEIRAYAQFHIDVHRNDVII